MLQSDIRYISITMETWTSPVGRTIVASSSAFTVNGSPNTPQSCLGSYHKTSFAGFQSLAVGLRFLGTTIRRNLPLYWGCCMRKCGCLVLFRAMFFEEKFGCKGGVWDDPWWGGFEPEESDDDEGCNGGILTPN